MDKEPEELEQRITDTRRDLADKVDALSDQLRDGARTARNQGLKVIGITAGVLGALLAIKGRFRSKKQ